MDELDLTKFGTNLSQDAIVQIKKLEYDHAAVSLGLRGTLSGACASLIALLVIVLVPLYMGHPVLIGYQIVGAIAAFVVPISLYGAFIFKSALDIAARVDRTGASGSAKVRPRADRNT